MKKLLLCFAAIFCLAGTAVALDDVNWKGVDETVIGKVAKEAGHPPRKPYINTDQGDLLLFLFLLAGAAGGSIGGYWFRSLFPPKNTAAKDHAPHP